MELLLSSEIFTYKLKMAAVVVYEHLFSMDTIPRLLWYLEDLSFYYNVIEGVSTDRNRLLLNVFINIIAD